MAAISFGLLLHAVSIIALGSYILFNWNFYFEFLRKKIISEINFQPVTVNVIAELAQFIVCSIISLDCYLLLKGQPNRLLLYTLRWHFSLLEHVLCLSF